MIYVLDQDQGADARMWNLFGIEELTICNFEPLTVPSRDTIQPEVPSGAILVCHNLSDRAFAAVKRCARRGVHAIVISGGNGGNGLDPDGPIYRRMLPVNKPVDQRFGMCLRAFAKNLAATGGGPVWVLLEGPRAPEALMAYHLLGLLDQSSRPSEVEQQVLADARAEVEEISRATGIAPVADLCDIVERRRFLNEYFLGK